jgi:hypothetical protein
MIAGILTAHGARCLVTILASTFVASDGLGGISSAIDFPSDQKFMLARHA